MLQCIADYYYDKTKKKKWTLIAVMIIDQKR